MKRFSLLKTVVTLVFIVSFAVTQTAFGQLGKKIDWQNDTISKTKAINAQFKFRNDWSGAGKKTTSSVTMPVDKLKEIIDACAAKGISEVKFLIVTVRAEEIDQYARQKPGMTASEKTDMIGRQILIAKVPRSAFFSGSTGFNKPVSGNNPLMLSLLSAGLMQYEMPGAAAAESLYFTFPDICPPPSSCGD